MTKKKTERIRLDELMVRNKLTPSREKARAHILAGEVRIGDHIEKKPGHRVSSESIVQLTADPNPFVSRGGQKLEHALKHFKVCPKDQVAIDIGASTGGFTECLLNAGSVKVYAIDVGYGQLAWKLQTDPRVIRMDRTNARYLEAKDLNDTPDLAVIDVSFISVRLILPALLPLLSETASLIALVKPQFEVGKEAVENKGIIKDPLKHLFALKNVHQTLSDLNWQVSGITPSPILGQKGNREFLLLARPSGSGDAVKIDEIQSFLEN